MTTRNFAVRLQLQDHEKFKRNLDSAGKSGKSLTAIERAGVPASGALTRLSTASRGLQASLRILEGPLGGVSGRFTALTAGIGASGIALGLGAAAVAGVSAALVTGLRHAEEALDTSTQLADTADRLKIGVEALQEYRFAAEQSGVATAQFEQAITALIRRQGEAINGNKQFADGFKQVGISVQELRTLSPEQLISRVADGLASIENQALRVAAADRIMSEAGRQVINVFSDGAEGLERFAQRARDAGVVLDERMVRSARETKNELDLMRKVIDTQLDSAFLLLAPTLVQIAGLFADIATEVADVADKMRAIEDISTRGLQRRLVQIDSELRTLRAQAAAAPDELLVGDIGVGLDSRQSFQGEIAQREREAERIRRQLAIREQEAAARARPRSEPGIAARAEADAIDELIAKYRDEIAILSVSKNAREEEAAVRRARAIAAEKDIELTQKQIDEIRELVREKQALKAVDETEAELQKIGNALDEEARRLIQGVRTEKEKLADLEKRLNDLVAARALTREQANTVLKRTKESTDAMTVAEQRLASTIETTLDDAIAGNIKSWRDLGRVAVAALQDILREILRTQRASAGGLFGGGGSGGGLEGLFSSIIGGLGSLFGGVGSSFLNTAATRTSVPGGIGGFATGGSFIVGGRGGPDSQIRALRLTPGEEVSVRTPAQQRGGGVNVVINNYSSAEVTARETRDPGGGVSLEVTIDDAMARQVRRPGSQTSRALIETFGARRALAAR